MVSGVAAQARDAMSEDSAVPAAPAMASWPNLRRDSLRVISGAFVGLGEGFAQKPEHVARGIGAVLAEADGEL